MECTTQVPVHQGTPRDYIWMCAASCLDEGCVRDLEPQLYWTVAPPVSALDENFRLPRFCCSVSFSPFCSSQCPAWMHAHARDGIKPWLPRFTDVLSQAGAALALKMSLLRFIVLNLIFFVLTNARLYRKKKRKRKKKKRKKCKRVIVAVRPPLVICGFIWMWQNKGPLVLFGVWNVW